MNEWKRKKTSNSAYKKTSSHWNTDIMFCLVDGFYGRQERNRSLFTTWAIVEVVGVLLMQRLMGKKRSVLHHMYSLRLCLIEIKSLGDMGPNHIRSYFLRVFSFRPSIQIQYLYTRSVFVKNRTNLKSGSNAYGDGEAREGQSHTHLPWSFPGSSLIWKSVAKSESNHRSTCWW